MLGPEAQTPKSCPAPKFLIGSIVISLSRCCLPNDAGPDPQIFFPRTATGPEINKYVVLCINYAAAEVVV